MTKFTKFELDDDPADLDEGDLVPTLEKFQEVHQENVERYEELEDEYSGLQNDFSEMEEAAEETENELEGAKSSLAEFAAEDSPLDPDEMTHLAFDRLCELAFDVSPPSGPTEPQDEDDDGKYSNPNKSKAGDFSDEDVEDSSDIVRETMSKSFGLD